MAASSNGLGKASPQTFLNSALASSRKYIQEGGRIPNPRAPATPATEEEIGKYMRHQTPRKRIVLNKSDSRPLHPKIEPSKPTNKVTFIVASGDFNTSTTAIINFSPQSFYGGGGSGALQATIVPTPTTILSPNVPVASSTTTTTSASSSPMKPTVVRVTKPSTPPVKKKKLVQEEPVCYTISSDEDDTDSSLSKDIADVSSNVIENGSNSEKFPLDRVINLECRSIRIGSFRLNVPSEKQTFHVLVKEEGFMFYAPTVVDLPEKTSMVLVRIMRKDIFNLIVSFNRGLPMLFLRTTASGAESIRKLLGMTKDSNIYYDPDNNKDVYKHIMFILHTLPDSLKLKLSQLFPLNKVLYEIEHQIANSILLSSTSNEIKSLTIDASVIPKLNESDLTNGKSSSPKLLIYPAPPMKGGITITAENLECLNEGEFLNDNIIEFYLKYLYLEKISAELREQVHIFSSFFYYCLTSGHPSSSKPAERYARVCKWTRSVDLFQKKYIIIPINIHSHWFLAIICLKPIEAIIAFQNEASEVDSSTPKGKNIQNLTKLGCIYLFDSLERPRHHWRVAACLREYLTMEWASKHPNQPAITFNANSMPAFFPQVPMQSNYSDCGLFILQYVESFLMEPFEDVHIPQTLLTEWFPLEAVVEKREKIRNLILSLKDRQEK